MGSATVSGLEEATPIMAWATTQPSLLVRLRDSADDDAWSEFDRRYGELIVRYGQRRGLSLPDAEDVRQIVLMHFARAVRSFEYSPQRGRFRSYLGRIVHNAISRQLARPLRGPIALDQDVLASFADPAQADDGVWEQEWVRHHLRLALQAVRPTCAPNSLEVFDRLLTGASTREVADAMNMSQEAVHKVKQRIRNRLKTVVAEQLAEEEPGA